MYFHKNEMVVKNLRIHAFINYSIADLGMINEWTVNRGHTVTTTAVYETSELPGMDDFDLLIVLGGVMGAYEEEENPWLRLEKKFISEAIKNNKAILGICLGAQLIAEVLGGTVYPHSHQEIGWWSVHFLDKAKDYKLFEGLPQKLPFFQYHGDTFDLPESATRLAESEATRNQAFIYKENVVGLQFHPEFSDKKLKEIVLQHGDEIESGDYIQLPNEFLGMDSNVKGAKNFLFKLLDNFESKIKTSV